MPQKTRTQLFSSGSGCTLKNILLQGEGIMILKGRIKFNDFSNLNLNN